MVAGAGMVRGRVMLELMEVLVEGVVNPALVEKQTNLLLFVLLWVWDTGVMEKAV